MADSKISALSSGAPAQAGDEYIVARSGSNYKLTLTNIAANMPATTVASGDLVVSSGNVGIGTSSPNFKEEVNQGSGSGAPSLRETPQLVLKGWGGGGTYHSGIGFSMSEHTAGYWGSGILEIDDSGSYGAALGFYTSTGSAAASPTEKLRIGSNGNVGIGTSSPSTKLDVSGTISDTAGNVRAIPKSGAAKTTGYTLATGDVGQFIEVGSGGSITVPDATFAAGDVVSIFNNTTGNVTLTMSITTAYIGGTDADKATITLATRGVATVLFISGTVCVVNGNVS